MADKAKTKTKNLKNTAANTTKAIAWVIEAAFRTFVGIVALQNFTGYVATAVAVYALLTAGVIIVSHFVKATSK
jgi:hypothetical protein